MTVSLHTDLLFVLYMNLCPHNAMFLYSTEFLNTYSRILVFKYIQQDTFKPAQMGPDKCKIIIYSYLLHGAESFLRS